MQERRNSSALAMELSLSCTNSLTCATKVIIYSIREICLKMASDVVIQGADAAII